MCDHGTFFALDYAEFFNHLDERNQRLLIAVMARSGNCPFAFFSHVLNNAASEHERYSLCFSYQGRLSNLAHDSFKNGNAMELSAILEMDEIDKANRLWLYFQVNNHFEPMHRGAANLHSKTEQERNLLATIQIK